MNSKKIIQEIISINKVIVENNLDKLKPTSKEMQVAYNTYVKPKLDSFKSEYGHSSNGYLKSILSKCNEKSIPNLKFKSYGNWGRKINPFVWSSFYLGHTIESIQLYISVNHLGIKFGFDYGSKVTKRDSLVEYVKSDKSVQKTLFDAINKFSLDVISLDSGSPNIEFSFDRKNNLIKEINDFEKWDSTFHIIKSYTEDNIPTNIEEQIIEVLNDLLPVYEKITIEDKLSESKGYWLYAPGTNANDWENQFSNGFMSIDYDFPDDLTSFKTKEDLDEASEEYGIEEGSMNTMRALWDFSNEINIGDIIIAKKGRSKYLGYGIVVSDYVFDEAKGEYRHSRQVNWKKKGSWSPESKLVPKTLTNITSYGDYIQSIRNIIGFDEISPDENSSDFDIDTLLKDVFIEKSEFENIIDILKLKKNIILQGSAGVGKTYIAKKIAQGLKEEYGDNNIEVVQFHQSYSYEDFIQGYRPNKELFELKNGIFYQICEKAKSDSSTPFFLVIDEINRGNLSKIFGELMMLIEPDKRGEKNKIKLTYSENNKHFYVPDNLYIIGTMNTADRSLTIVDYALRRRFAFIDMKPKFNSQFEKFSIKNGLSQDNINVITQKMNSLNSIIRKDDSLGEGFEIGHSYFCSYSTGNQKRWLDNVFKYEIIPLIKEYWFDNPEKIAQYSDEILS